MGRIRIGYGGPEGYPHGYRRRHGNMRGMSEFERFLHLFVSLQILFGSRRGSLLIPIAVVALCVGGWFAWQHFNNADRPLATIDADWDTGDTKKRIRCIREYKQLLQKKDPIETSRYFLKVQRERIYRRIITHHVKFDLDEADAADWIRMARDEGFDSPARLEIIDPTVVEFWNKTVERLKAVNSATNSRSDRGSQFPSDNKPDNKPDNATGSDDSGNSGNGNPGNGNSGTEKERIDIPGIDDSSGVRFEPGTGNGLALAC